MVQSVNPLGSAGGTQNTQSQQEKQKQFEIEFETAVLSSYLAVTRQNGHLQDQISKIKKGMDSGKSPDLLATDINSLVSQINHNIPAGQVPFPNFGFSTEGSQVAALQYFCISLEKMLQSAAHNHAIKGSDEQKLFGELSSLWKNAGQMTPEQAFGTLNGIIEQANNVLPEGCQISTIPLTQGR